MVTPLRVLLSLNYELAREEKRIFLCSKVFVFGGAVRDVLLKREIKDMDIATTSEDIKKKIIRILKDSLFAKEIDIGKKFGLSRFVLPGNFIIDIHKIDKLYEFLQSRDFTINSLAVPLLEFPHFFLNGSRKNLIDFCNGYRCLKRNTIRLCYGKAFEDDPVRILRLARLSSQLGFFPEKEALKKAEESVHKLSDIAKERICEEIIAAAGKNSGFYRFLSVISESGIDKHIFKKKTSDRDLQLIKEFSIMFYNASTQLLAGKRDYSLLPYVRIAIVLWQKNVNKKAKIKPEIKPEINNKRDNNKLDVYPEWTKHGKNQFLKAFCLIEEAYFLVKKLDSENSKKKLEYLAKNAKNEIIAYFLKSDSDCYLLKISLLMTFREVLKVNLYHLNHLDLAKIAKISYYVKSARNLLSGNEIFSLIKTGKNQINKVLYELQIKVVKGRVLNKKDAVMWVSKNYGRH